MSPRQARRERREAERKAKRLELKKSRLAQNHPRLALPHSVNSNLPAIQPSWKPKLEDEFTSKDICHEVAPAAGTGEDSARQRELATFSTETCDNSIADRISIRAGMPIPPSCRSQENGFVSQKRRTQANRANAKLSTGPRTANGKLASSRNSTKHGLASGTLLIPGEDPAAFEALLHDLFEEHQPATPSEELLVKEMAQSYWLSQRAIRLQNTCFTADGVNEKQLALFLRYGTAHERRFYKALNCLLQLKKEPARAERGFVSQRPVTPAPQIGFVSQKDTPTSALPQSVRQEAVTYSVEAS